MSTSLHHIGIAVFSLDEALKFYRDVLGLTVSSIEEIESEGVRVAILPLGESRLELLEPLNEKSPLHRSLTKRGEGVHHIALGTASIREILAKLATGKTQMLGEPRQGAGKSKITFIHPKSAHGVLLELCEE